MTSLDITQPLTISSKKEWGRERNIGFCAPFSLRSHPSPCSYHWPCRFQHLCSPQTDPSPDAKDNRKERQDPAFLLGPGAGPRAKTSSISMTVTQVPIAASLSSYLTCLLGTWGHFYVFLYLSQLCSQDASYPVIFNLINRLKPHFYVILSCPAFVLSIMSPVESNQTNVTEAYSSLTRLSWSHLSCCSLSPDSLRGLHEHSHVLN